MMSEKDVVVGPESSITEIIEYQTAGQVTAEELVYRCFERIAEIDSSGPELNSVLQLNPEAPAIAAGLDLWRESGKPLGLLHGVPVMIKGNIDTGDTMCTSAGTLALAESYAPDDAYLVTRLREAGAVIIGKTNLTEMANFMTKGMPNGYSTVGGQVRNPYGADLDPGGSSTGSAVAVAAGLCAGAVGTETCGSILSPAVANMVVGVKPTVGLVSRDGIVPISYSQDTAGPIARTVTDAARLLAVIRGMDSADRATAASAEHAEIDYGDYLIEDLSDLRIGIPRKVFWERLDDSQKRIAEMMIQLLRENGAEVVDPADITTAPDIGPSKVMLYEFKPAIQNYLHSLGPQAPIRTLLDLVRFNRKHAGRCLKYGQTTLLQANAASGRLVEAEYIESRLDDLRLCRTEGIDATLRSMELDVLLFPSITGCVIGARAGYPTVVVPVGFAESKGRERPYGVSFCGPAFSEAVLLRCAYSLEQSLEARTPPGLGVDDG